MTTVRMAVTSITVTSTVIGVVSFVFTSLFQRVKSRVEVVLSNTAFSAAVIV